TAMTPRLLNKRCLLVGATSGIGLAAARRFLEEGAAVVVAGLPTEPLADDARAGLQALGRVTQVACDVQDAAEVARLFAEAVPFPGGMDVLYHVAGASGRRHGDGPLHECSDAGWNATIAANLTTTFLTNRAAVAHFLAQRQPGVILNMASVLALSPSPAF